MARKGRIGDRYRKVKISHEQVKKQNKKQYAKIAFLAIFLLLLTIGGSYALFTTTLTPEKQTEIVSGTLTIEYEDKNEINLDNAYPMTDEQGLNTDAYVFTIKNTGTLNGKYTISLEEKDTNTLDKSYVKYSIREKDGEWSSPTPLSSGLILKENIIIESGSETTYELKMWLDLDAPNEVQGKTYSGKIVVNTIQTNANQVVTTSPIIELNGEKVVKIEENTEYVDAGVSSINSTESLSIENVTTRYEYYDGTNTIEVENIDTSKVGIYYIYYEIEDSKGNVGITSRVVNVYKTDTNIPTIMLKGESLISLDYGEAYIEPGYSASDIEDIDLTSKVVVVGTVNEEVAGTYTIKYIVIDSSGNTSSVTREVIVSSKNGELDVEIEQENTDNTKTQIDISTITSLEVKIAITTTSEKPSDSEFKTLEELQNEGVVSENGKIVIIKNGTYYIWFKDSNGNIECKEVVVTTIDETIPVCEFSEESYVGLNKTLELTLTCTDPANITNETITSEYFETDEKINVTVGTGTKIENGYKYIVTVTGKKEGDSTLKLLSEKIYDYAGNKSDEVTKTIKVTNIEVDATEVKLDINGTNTHQIEVTGTNQGSISYTSSDESIVTVSTSGLITGVSPGTAIIKVTESNAGISKEITVTVVKTLNATFTIQSSGVTKISSTQETCEVVDDSGSCKVKLPTIEVSTGYTVMGWNTNKDATTGLETDSEGKVSITDTPTKFYTIIRKDEVTLSATFYRNGAASLNNLTTDTVEVSCKLDEVYNTQTQLTECDITTPTIEASDDTPNIVGFAEDKDATVKDIDPATKLTINSNSSNQYYAITKSELKTYTATFNLNGAVSQTDEDGNEVTGNVTRKCNIPITYNGVAQDTSCDITTPTITASSNTPIVCGYTTTSIGTSSCSIKMNETLPLTETENTYYAQTYKSAVTKNIDFKIATDSHVTKIETESSSVTNTTDSITKTCDIDEAYNGATQATSCNVISPTITVETGYKNAFWGTSADSTSGTTSGGSVSSTNSTYYARALTGNSYTVNYYDGTTLKSSSSTTVGTSFTLKTASSMSLTKTGYTFKGWATTSGSATVAYTDGQSVSNLTTTDGESVNLYAIWVDETAPSCTWSTPGTIYTKDETTLTLTCTDTGSGLSNKTLTTSDFNTSDSTYGIVTDVSESSAITNGYSYEVTIKGLSSGSTSTTNGSFTVSLNPNIIKDEAGNYTDETISDSVTVKGITRAIKFTVGDNVSSISSTSASCTSVGTATDCSITLTEDLVKITPNEGYVTLGWFIEDNDTEEADYEVGDTIKLTTSEITLIAKARIVNASELSYDNSETGVDCATVQCMLDEVYKLVE